MFSSVYRLCSPRPIAIVDGNAKTSCNATDTAGVSSQIDNPSTGAEVACLLTCRQNHPPA